MNLSKRNLHALTQTETGQPSSQPDRKVRFRNPEVWIVGSVVTVVVSSVFVFAGRGRIDDFVMGRPLRIHEARLQSIKGGDVFGPSTTAEYTVLVESLSNQPVNIVGASLPCSCLGISPMPVEIDGGGRAQITLTIAHSKAATEMNHWVIPLFVDAPSPPLHIKVDLTQLKQ